MRLEVRQVDSSVLGASLKNLSRGESFFSNFFPGFPIVLECEFHVRGVFAGLVTTVVLLGSAVLAEILPFVSVLTLSRMGFIKPQS